MKYTKHESESTSAENSSDSAVPADYSFSLKEYHLEGLPYFLIGGTTVSYIMFLGVGGFLHVSPILTWSTSEMFERCSE